VEPIPCPSKGRASVALGVVLLLAELVSVTNAPDQPEIGSNTPADSSSKWITQIRFTDGGLPLLNTSQETFRKTSFAQIRELPKVAPTVPRSLIIAVVHARRLPK